jgi:hypothetical protein
MKRKKISRNLILSFLIGLWLGFTPYVFYLADLERGYDGIGGEILFPFVPLLVGVIIHEVKDMTKDLRGDEQNV